jgi:hypothetical protein
VQNNVSDTVIRFYQVEKSPHRVLPTVKPQYAMLYEEILDISVLTHRIQDPPATIYVVFIPGVGNLGEKLHISSFVRKFLLAVSTQENCGRYNRS